MRATFDQNAPFVCAEPFLSANKPAIVDAKLLREFFPLSRRSWHEPHPEGLCLLALLSVNGSPFVLAIS
jgi:hypothetical protein